MPLALRVIVSVNPFLASRCRPLSNNADGWPTRNCLAAVTTVPGGEARVLAEFSSTTFTLSLAEG